MLRSRSGLSVLLILLSPSAYASEVTPPSNSCGLNVLQAAFSDGNILHELDYSPQVKSIDIPRNPDLNLKVKVISPRDTAQDRIGLDANEQKLFKTYWDGVFSHYEQKGIEGHDTLAKNLLGDTRAYHQDSKYLIFYEKTAQNELRALAGARITHQGNTILISRVFQNGSLDDLEKVNFYTQMFGTATEMIPIEKRAESQILGFAHTTKTEALWKRGWKFKEYGRKNVEGVTQVELRAQANDLVETLLAKSRDEGEKMQSAFLEQAKHPRSSASPEWAEGRSLLTFNSFGTSTQLVQGKVDFYVERGKLRCRFEGFKDSGVEPEMGKVIYTTEKRPSEDIPGVVETVLHFDAEFPKMKLKFKGSSVLGKFTGDVRYETHLHEYASKSTSGSRFENGLGWFAKETPQEPYRNEFKFEKDHQSVDVKFDQAVKLPMNNVPYEIDIKGRGSVVAASIDGKLTEFRGGFRVPSFYKTEFGDSPLYPEWKRQYANVTGQKLIPSALWIRNYYRLYQNLIPEAAFLNYLK